MARSNVRRLRPKEVSLVADILSEPAEDVEQLAKDVLRALNAYRATEPLYVRLVKDDNGRTVLLYGPYPTPADALADSASMGIGREGTWVSVRVAPLHGPYGAETVEE